VLCYASVATLDGLLRSVVYKAASSLSYTSCVFFVFLVFFLSFLALFLLLLSVCLSFTTVAFLACFALLFLVAIVHSWSRRRKRGQEEEEELLLPLPLGRESCETIRVFCSSSDVIAHAVFVS